MSSHEPLSRRRLLRVGVAAVAGTLARPDLLLADCEPTPGRAPSAPDADVWSGPFWRSGAPFRYNLRGRRNDGRVLVVSGRVTRAGDCRPVPGAVLDIWHCGPDGEYFTNPEQASAGLFRGRIRCDENGYYEYETLVPVPYLVGGAFRPAHVHVTTHARGHDDLNTQMYFEGDPYLASDPLEIVREPLICKLQHRETGDTFGERRATGPFSTTRFDIQLPNGNER